MSVLSEVRQERGYLRAIFTGLIDTEWVGVSPEVFDQAWDACLRATTPRLLMDIRACTMDVAIADRFFLGVAYAGHPLARVRVAVLGTPDHTTPDRFFELVARNRGANVRVFTDEAAAVAWLYEPDGAKVGLSV